jgi:pyrroloquinoline quinone biosynthesis protein E
MSKNILKHIVIKPTLACTANCSTCGTRKMLHKGLIAGKDRMLTFDDWEIVLKDANSLGVKRLDISGGELMIYKNLVDLVKIGKTYGWHVNINTNGSLVIEEKAKNLVNAGLNSMYIFYYTVIMHVDMTQ